MQQSPWNQAPNAQPNNWNNNNGAAGYAGYAQAPQARPAIGMAPAAPSAPQSFVNGLFDFSFKVSVTPMVMKVLYGIFLFVLGCGILMSLYNAFDQMFLEKYGSVGAGIVTLLLIPPASFLYVVIGRVYFEVLIVLFRIADNLSEINRKTREASS